MLTRDAAAAMIALVGSVGRGVLVVVIGLLVGSAPVAAVAAPAVRAAARSRPVNVTITGSLTVSWSSDPDRGCAVAGLCGVSGSLQMLPAGSTGTSGGPVPLEPQDQTATIREVTRSAGGGVVSTCATVTPVDFTLSIRQTPQGLRAVIPRGAAFLPPSSGPCPGPTAADLVGLTLPARRFGRHSYDLSGSTRLSAGPFDVTFDSTLRALVWYGNSLPAGGPIAGVGAGTFSASGPGPTQPIRTRFALQETADVQYRIQSISGSLGTGISGLPSPLCAALGACGDSGQLVARVAGAGSLTFSAARIVSRPVSRTGVLRDLRSGRLRLNGYPAGLPARVATSENLAQADGSTCHDSVSGGLAEFQVAVHRGSDLLQLALPGGAFGIDPLRTRCPGPPAAEVLGNSGILAAAPLPPSQIGRARLALSLSSVGAFSGLSWSGGRGGTLVLRLARVRERAGTRRVRLVIGEPGVTLP